jgi:hypothetical protein
MDETLVPNLAAYSPGHISSAYGERLAAQL